MKSDHREKFLSKVHTEERNKLSEYIAKNRKRFRGKMTQEQLDELVQEFNKKEK